LLVPPSALEPVGTAARDEEEEEEDENPEVDNVVDGTGKLDTEPVEAKDKGRLAVILPLLLLLAMLLLFMLATMRVPSALLLLLLLLLLLPLFVGLVLDVLLLAALRKAAMEAFTRRCSEDTSFVNAWDAGKFLASGGNVDNNDPVACATL
jgi:hypothetical protein